MKSKKEIFEGYVLRLKEVLNTFNEFCETQKNLKPSLRTYCLAMALINIGGIVLIEIKNLKFPIDRKYYKRNGNHIWLKQEGDIIKIGMDSFLTENAGYLSYLTLDSNKFSQGEAIGSFESAKFVSKFYSPVGGEIVNTNEEVINDPIRINKDPYNAWIVEIRPTNFESDLNSDDILDGEEDIRKWIEEELKRLDEDACQ
jgi:glycine cleavage system H protein